MSEGHLERAVRSEVVVIEACAMFEEAKWSEKELGVISICQAFEDLVIAMSDRSGTVRTLMWRRERRAKCL